VSDIVVDPGRSGQTWRPGAPNCRALSNSLILEYE
jgi:hypothetical protein